MVKKIYESINKNGLVIGREGILGTAHFHACDGKEIYAHYDCSEKLFDQVGYVEWLMTDVVKKIPLNSPLMIESAIVKEIESNNATIEAAKKLVYNDKIFKYEVNKLFINDSKAFKTYVAIDLIPFEGDEVVRIIEPFCNVNGSIERTNNDEVVTYHMNHSGKQESGQGGDKSYRIEFSEGLSAVDIYAKVRGILMNQI